MIEIQAPHNILENIPNKTRIPPILFMAGGITGAPDWQKHMLSLLADTNFIICNPRRDSQEKINSKEQIQWEYKHFNVSDSIFFWFPYPAKCMITLFELGRWTATKTGKKIFVGVDPKYERKEDIEIQLSLNKAVPISIVYDLESLANQIKDFYDIK